MTNISSPGTPSGLARTRRHLHWSISSDVCIYFWLFTFDVLHYLLVLYMTGGTFVYLHSILLLGMTARLVGTHFRVIWWWCVYIISECMDSIICISYCCIIGIGGHACGEIRWSLVGHLIFGPGVGKLWLYRLYAFSVQGALSVKRTGHAEFFSEIKEYFYLKLFSEINWINFYFL